MDTQSSTAKVAPQSRVAEAERLVGRSASTPNATSPRVFSSVILQDHVRPVGPVPTSGLWSLAKVVGKCITLAFRFLGAYVIGKGDLKYADKLLNIFWRKVFQWGNAKLVVENAEVFDGQPAIVMSNHTSLLDVPTLLGAVPVSVRMVFKESLAKIPVFGWGLVAAGMIPIDRGNREKAIRQLENAKRIFAKGVNVWVSPEGTRSRGRGLLPFKKGGFHLAKQLHTRIIPAYIHGTEQMISPTSLKVVQDGVVIVRYGDPISTEGKDVEQLMVETRAAIVALGASLGSVHVLAEAQAARDAQAQSQQAQVLGRSSENRSPNLA